MSDENREVVGEDSLFFNGSKSPLL